MRHATIDGIQQTLTLLGLTLGLVHALAQLAAPGGPVRVVDEFLPFTNPTDPIGIGLGVIALELMAALALSVLVQRWLATTGGAGCTFWPACRTDCSPVTC